MMLFHADLGAFLLDKTEHFGVAMARTGADLEDPEVEVVDLGCVGREAVERIRPLAEGAGLKISVEGPGGRVRAL